MKIFGKIVLVAFAALPILAQSPQPQLGVIHGTVVRAGTGDPVTGATLTLSVAPPKALIDSLSSLVTSTGMPPGEAQSMLAEMMRQTPEFLANGIAQAKANGDVPAAFLTIVSEALALKTATKGFPLRAVSDSGGRFTLTGVPSGVFTLLVHRDGYFGVPPNVAPHGDHEDVSLPVTVRDLQTTVTTTVTVTMNPGAVISGRLRDVSGRAATNVTVHAMQMGYVNGILGLGPARSAQTDDTGQFRLFWLGPGEYFLAATPAVSTGASMTFYPSTTESTTANVINVSTGQDVSNMNFSLQTARTLTVSGEVTENGGTPNPLRSDESPASLPNLTVRLVRRDSLTIVGSPGIEGTFPIVAGRKIAFELRGVPSGSYDLYASTASNLRGNTSLRVGDEDVTGIQLDLQLNVTVPGVVIVDGTPLTGNASARIVLSPFDPETKSGFERSQERNGVAIASDGKFLVPNNPWGSYAVRIVGLPPDAYIDEVQQGALNVYDSGVNVTGDAFRYATDQITVKVKSNGGRVEGTVQTTDRKPSSGAVVVLVPPAARRRNPSLYRTTTSDSEGRFSLRGIQPGEYRVFAWDSVPEGAWRNAEFLAKYETQGRAVAILPSTSTPVEIVTAR